MFSKELEELIRVTLEDGIIEEHERAALHKRAQAEGADLAELDIYVNSLIQRRKRELELEREARMHQYEQQRRQAYGRTCPNCGAPVPPMTAKCDCGYEFSQAEVVSSVQLLARRIEEINGQPLKSKDPDSEKYKAEIQYREQRVRDAIMMFPVPNTKEDIIEFLSMAVSNAKQRGGILGTVTGRLFIFLPTVLILATLIAFVIFICSGSESAGVWFILLIGYGVAGAIAAAFKFDKETLRWNKNASVWRAKYDQVLMKGRSMRGDAEFQRQLDSYENLMNPSNKKNVFYATVY